VADLTSKKCVPCESGTPPVSKNEAQKLLSETPGWKIEEQSSFREKVSEDLAYSHLTKEFNFKDFKEAIKFVNNVAEIAEEEGHHPDIYIFYSLVRLTLWTHAAGGLTENDFILAAKVNKKLL
jgi:4a-hydroxytetrahydrobiopterin dehydratase